jgi:hypothetical protein
MCCSDCPPIAYILPPAPTPPKPLAVTQGDPECSALKPEFSVVLTVTGGTAPYTYSFNGNTQSDNTIVLPGAGPDTTVIITDAAKQTITTVIKSHTCPGSVPLNVTQGDPVCDTSNRFFTVVVTATGGTAPYSYNVNGTTQTDSTVKLASGGPDATITVTDAAGHAATITIKSYTCQTPCNLPCDGLAENCKYALWLPEPLDKDNIVQKTSEANLILTDENGTANTIPVTDIFIDNLDSFGNLNGSFKTQLDKLFGELNKRIADKLKDNDAVFTYNDDSKTISIEQFTCQKIELAFDGKLIINDITRPLDVNYANDAVTVSLTQAGAQVVNFEMPKFDCHKLDKCNKTDIPLCRKALKIDTISVVALPASGQYGFSAAPAGSFDTWLWYIHDGAPMYSNDAQPKVFINQNITTTNVRVLAVNSETGCFATLQQDVGLFGKR